MSVQQVLSVVASINWTPNIHSFALFNETHTIIRHYSYNLDLAYYFLFQICLFSLIEKRLWLVEGCLLMTYMHNFDGFNFFTAFKYTNVKLNYVNRRCTAQGLQMMWQVIRH